MPIDRIPGSLLSLNSVEPVNQQIHRVLRKLIINNTLIPGERIVDKEIASLFGVSKQPVRDACSRLANARLLKVLPQRGTFVMKISPLEVKSGQFVREAAEVAITQRAACVMDDSSLQTLTQNLVEQEKAAKIRDLSGFLDLDETFHRILTISIGSTVAWDAIENIKAGVDRIRYLTPPEATPMHSIAEQHFKILECIRQRKPDEAGHAMKIHMQGIFIALDPIIEKNPDWFESAS